MCCATRKFFRVSSISAPLVAVQDARVIQRADYSQAMSQSLSVTTVASTNPSRWRFGSKEENAYGTDAFDPQWDDQGGGTVGRDGEVS